MPNLAECAIHALEPYVGRMVADTCIRATALSTGKTADSLTLDDLPGVEASIKRLLAPVAAAPTIQTVLDEIARECR